MRIYDGGFHDVHKAHLYGHTLDFIGVADEDDVGDIVGNDAVGGFECAAFGTFGQHDALAVGLCFLGEILEQIHVSGDYVSFISAKLLKIAIGCNKKSARAGRIICRFGWNSDYFTTRRSLMRAFLPVRPRR